MRHPFRAAGAVRRVAALVLPAAAAIAYLVIEAAPRLRLP